MNSYLKPLLILLVVSIFTSCKKEATLSEYKYADKEYTVQCEGVNPELLKEAVYSFEDDITNHFARNGNKNLSQAYSRAVNAGIYGRTKYNEIVSSHTKEIFKILKEDTNLWNTEGKTKTLNYNSEFVKCLADNISNKDIKTTFNALLSTNSMSPKLFGEALRRQSGLALKDKNLATYIALDLYYAKLFDVDFDAPIEEKKNIDFNKTPSKSPVSKKVDLPMTKEKATKIVDPHAGHNH